MRSSTSSSATRTPRLLPRLPPVRGAADRPRRATGRAPRPVRPHPVARVHSWSVLPLEIRRAIHDGLLANDAVGFHTRRWRRNFMRAAEDIVGAVPDWANDALGYDGRRVGVIAHARSRSIRRSSTSSRTARPCSRPAASSRRTGRTSSCSASTALTLPRTSCAASARSSSTSTRTRRCTGGSACSRCSTLRGRRSPSTPSTSARSSARRGASNDRFQQDGWMPIDLQVSRHFPRAVAAYKDTTCSL